MSAPVDVLAVMDRLIGNARTMCGLSGDKLLRVSLREGEEARAAMAELIEAADKLQHVYRLMDKDPDFVRLRAALANVGGAA